MEQLKYLMTVLLLFGMFALFAQTEDIRKSTFNLEDSKYAIQGYDPVSYFNNDKPLKGKKEFTSRYKGVYYRFASKANQELFKKKPGKYEPAYGGWCAYAMAEGEKVKIDPKTYKIIDGKLFLFYNFNFTNTLKSWNKDESTLKKDADTQWEIIIE